MGRAAGPGRRSSAAGTRSAAPIWIMALIGVGTTAYGYWNSDKIAIRSMQAYPVTEAQAPAALPDCPGAVRPRQPADAAHLHLAHHGAECLRHRPEPAERGSVLHRGHPAAAGRARTARGAGPRTDARLQPGHPDVLGGRRRRRRHHLGGADACCSSAAGTAATRTRSP